MRSSMNIVNDKVTEYLEGFYKPLSPFLGSMRMQAEENHVPIILKETEDCMRSYLQIIKPNRILEIGTAVGYSSIFFANLLPEVEITSLEVNESMFQTATKNIKDAGLEHRIEVLLGDAVEGLVQLKISREDNNQSPYDLVFIDASKGHYKEFWDGCLPLCKKDAIILSDNVLFKGKTVSDEYVTDRRQRTMVRRMREYMEYITNLAYADTAVLSVGDGLAVSVLRGYHE